MDPGETGKVARFGIRVPPCASLHDVAACVERAEARGFHTAWVPDSQFLFRDPWMALAASAAVTHRIRLAMGVTNLRTRHPSVTAAALQTLEEAAPGRAVLGVGTGDSSVKALGIDPSRLHEVEDAFREIRLLGRGQELEYGGRFMRLRDATGRVPPLFMAATGPRALRLAGRTADGVLIMAGVTPSLVNQALAHLDEGLREAGRSRQDIEVCLGAVTYVAKTDTDVVRIAKPHCAGDAQRGAGEALDAAGVHLKGTVPQHVPGVYPDITHADDWDQAVAAAGRWVDDEAAARYAETFTLIGTPDVLAERIGAAVSAGVDSFYLRHYHSYVLPEDLIELFAAELLPRFPTPRRG